jgi:CRISPR-associated exonuclease Cas4
MRPEDVGGVHIKYLHHCPRQLWLYARGIRPEHLNPSVLYGEALHNTSYPRSTPIDLGAARLDQLDGECWVHEVKSSASPTGEWGVPLSAPSDIL